MRTGLRRGAAVALGLLAAPLAVEVWARVAEPRPRTQIVAASEELEVLPLGRTHIWRSPDGVTREARACQAQDRVLVLGSSILFGSGVSNEETWSARVGLVGTCVHNLSGPGYGVEAKLARLAHELPTMRPRLVVWEVWANDANRWAWAGQRGYSLNPTMPVDELGLPNAFGLPAGFNRALLAHSRAYELANLARIEVADGQPDFLGPLEQVHALTQEAGVDLLLVFPPTLDKPFAATVAEPTDFQREVRPWAEALGIRTISLAELLVDQDHEALRLDPCCHYNAEGHGVLAERLGPELAR